MIEITVNGKRHAREVEDLRTRMGWGPTFALQPLSAAGMRAKHSARALSGSAAFWISFLRTMLMHDLLECCRYLLEKDGRLFLLLPYKRETELKVKIQAAGFGISRHVRVKQSVNHGYFRTMLELCFKGPGEQQTNYEEIAIKDDQEQYSDAFTTLLRDYYLYL